ncbi:MAG TPA: SH3-like domain-containing protein [Ramlibacter sp.]|nr:SH3-like domain-containing protein [Ramlibacter sp.]
MAPEVPVARFVPGDAVKVLALGKPGHIRTPDYILHKHGEVVQFCGYFLNPEDLSVGRTAGPVVALYRVRFPMRTLWPEYQRHPGDALFIEIYDHWLAPAEAVAH